MLIMLKFMDCFEIRKDYNLAARIRDCEPNLFSFNYLSPMAVCIEAMVKSAWLDFNPKASPDEAGEITLYNLMFNKKDDEIRQYKPFRKWFKDKYDIDQNLLNDVDRLIRVDSNKFKHHLPPPGQRNPDQIKPSFECFYKFAAKYYEQKTGIKAPPWDESKYAELTQSEDERVNRHTDIMMSMR